MTHVSPEKDLSPREQVFEVYRKISAGEVLTGAEEKLVSGLPQRVPKDKIHEGVRLVEERKINKSQLKDCYICHR